jgi:hypothetical protein
MYLTPTKLANLQINLGALDADSQALIDLIEEDYESKQNMRDGENYYIGNHTEILNKEISILPLFIPSQGLRNQTMMHLTTK